MDVLPVDKAADALLAVNPTLGAVVLFETAALVFMVRWVITMQKDHARALAEKDKLVEQANAAHIADLKVNIPALHDLRETILDLANRPGGRR